MKVILASTSKYRKAQLKSFGLSFRAVRPLFDEETLKSMKTPPRKLCAELASRKALSLSEKFPDAVIIGADQLVSLNRQILGKPKTRTRAIQMLKKMSGKTHELITAVTVSYSGQSITQVVVAKVKMRKLSGQEITKYVDLDKPLDCAGSYKFEKGGLKLMESVTVNDPSALIGLPLIALSRGLRKLGVKKI